MIRQRSLCAILQPERQKTALLRHPSAKCIKIRSNNSSRQTSPLAIASKHQTMAKQPSVNSLIHTLREKRERGQSKGYSKEQSKTGVVHRQEKKASKGSSPINIKKDLKYLISKNSGVLPKKKEAAPMAKNSKPKISNPFDQKPIRPKEELTSKRSSFCQLKVIKEEKYPKSKSKKKLSSKKSKLSSKESSLDPIHKDRSTNQKSQLESSSNRPAQIDPQHKQVSRALCSEFTGKRSGHQKPNFLQFFKQYRNSFDLRGIKHEQERSKLKSGRFATEAEPLQQDNYGHIREA